LVADADRDSVYLVDLASARTQVFEFAPGDQPGRAADDGAGHAFVLMRGAGAIQALDIHSGQILARRSVCAAPRGLAIDPAGAQLFIACADGELIEAPTSLDGPFVEHTIASDLRDVVFDRGRLWVSRFRSAELLELPLPIDGQGTRHVPDGYSVSGRNFAAGTAWRMVPRESGGVLVVHQRADATVELPTGRGAYAHLPNGPLVQAALTRWPEGESSASLPNATLPVDVALRSDGLTAIALAGNSKAQLPSALLVGPSGQTLGLMLSKFQTVGVAFTSAGDLVLLSREPAELAILSPPEVPAARVFLSLEVDRIAKRIPLSPISREETGHAIFHADSGAGVACASCHPEGEDDGRSWRFLRLGVRRTPSLLGTVAGTAPYHWGGEMQGLTDLVEDVYVGRMSGPLLDLDFSLALIEWTEGQPAPRRPEAADPLRREAGRTLFFGRAGCGACHGGASYTNNLTLDVGTGGAFQVPSLVGVARRLPLMHDGCATTLEERFGPCGGAQHGNLGALGPEDIAALVEFLKTI
jgi:hypothetical protein